MPNPAQDPSREAAEQALQAAHRYHLVGMDMWEVGRMLLAIKEVEGHTADRLTTATTASLRKGMLMAAVVCYCRGFVRSNSVGNAARKIGTEMLRLSSEQQALHDLLLERRDQGIAHSDWNYHHTRVIEIRTFGATRSTHEPALVADISIAAFEDLASRVCIHALFTAQALEAHVQNPALPNPLLRNG